MHNQSCSILLALANLLRFEIMIYGLPSPRLVGFKFDFFPLGEKLRIINSFLPTPLVTPTFLYSICLFLLIKI